MSIDPIGRGTEIVRGLLANYRTGTKLTPDRYVKVPLFWITAAFRAFAAVPAILLQSSIVRKTKTPERIVPSSLCSPSMRGTKGRLPVAIMS